MKHRLLGKSGLRLSEVALGTMTFGDDVVLATKHSNAARFAGHSVQQFR